LIKGYREGENEKICLIEEGKFIKTKRRKNFNTEVWLGFTNMQNK
jgi:hypothetical protein